MDDFCSFLYLFYKLLIIWATCKHFSIILIIFGLPFVLLRRKGGVFVILDRDCIFNRSSDFCHRMAKGRIC